ncbi:hypothetical protein EEB11_15710 [Pseudotabrizicola sediminis]|uniref:Transposase IS66 family protein n=1 Tax=Pseudotabrizicola sediminis TaxID=2486418 RepID=A0ABY2KI42_9RHOB|nr:hypothetical protein EEB11_15710 [Pseudotabrizicola sediminis]
MWASLAHRIREVGEPSQGCAAILFHAAVQLHGFIDTMAGYDWFARHPSPFPARALRWAQKNEE